MIPGILTKRLNRFAASISLSGKAETAHVPNSGRLRELLVPGKEVLVSAAENSERKTRFTLKAVKHGDIWVSIDSTLVNKVIEDALKNGKLPIFKEIKEFKREVTYKHSRFDFHVTEEGKKGCYLEVKSVTLVKDRVAMFPDAPTERGRKHLLELKDAVKRGYRGVVIFCVQRPDADSFRPYDENDPTFGKALREARRNGVEVYAFKCNVLDGEPVLDREVEVSIE